VSDRAGDGSGVITLSRRAAGPVLARVLGVLGARAELPVDRVSDLLVVADLIAAAHDDGAAVRVEFATAARRVDLVVGPLPHGVAQRLLDQPQVAGVALLPRLADEVELAGGPDERHVRLRFA
jgi:serine/threonine-protein kinase RsbW